jgi:GNAT superfamily N-acetyltransferase
MDSEALLQGPRGPLPLARPVPVIRLGPADRPRLLAHFLALSEGDRNCRFGAGCSDEGIERYVASIDLERACTLAICAADGRLLAVAHVPVANGVAELGISVLPRFRRRNFATLLAQRAVREARTAGAREFVFDFTASNAGMQRLAERLQMTTERLGAALVARLPLAAPLAV